MKLKYDLPYADCVHYFVRWYKKTYPKGFHEDVKPVDAVHDTSSSDQNLLNQLREANLKIAGLEMMIQTAQKELGVDIVKKPGTKQSSK